MVNTFNSKILIDVNHYRFYILYINNQSISLAHY